MSRRTAPRRPMTCLALTVLAFTACGSVEDGTSGGGDGGPSPIAAQPGVLAMVELYPWAEGVLGQAWLELFNSTRYPVSLAGCTCSRRALDQGGAWEEQAIAATPDGAPAVVPPLGYLLLATRDCADLPEGTPCAVCPAAAPGSSGRWELRLGCAGEEQPIDSLTCDPAASGLVPGTSLALPEEAFGQDPTRANDTEAAWCPAAATPCGDNACLKTSAGPGAGELALVELYVRAAAGERQWMEIVNASVRQLGDIESCRLTLTRLDKDPPVDVVGNLKIEEPLVLEPGERAVLIKSKCEGAVAETAPCASYTNIDMRSTLPDRLVLSCPSVLQPGGYVEVDRLEYRLSDHGVQPGQSLLFPDTGCGDDPARDNDTADCWCAAPPSPGEGAECP